jgi:hypothetical protein
MRHDNWVFFLAVGVAAAWLFAADAAQAQFGPRQGRMQSMGGGGCGQRGPGGPQGSMMRTGPNPYPYPTNGANGAPQPYDPGMAAMLQAGGYQANVLQQANGGPLLTAFQGVYRNNNATEAQQRTVQTQLAALFAGANQPDADTLANLADDLTAALAAGKMNPRQAAKLSQDAAGVANGGARSRAALGSLRTDLRTLRSARTLTAQALQTLSDDLDAVLRPVLPNGLVANLRQ